MISSEVMRNPREGCIRPPLAKHYSWGRSRVVDDDIHESLRILEHGNPPEALERLAEVLKVPLLPRQAEERLYHGEPKGERSHRAVFFIASEHIRNGGTLESFRDDMLDANNVGGEKVREHRKPWKFAEKEWYRIIGKVQTGTARKDP